MESDEGFRDLHDKGTQTNREDLKGVCVKQRSPGPKVDPQKNKEQKKQKKRQKKNKP